jgi:hypothetical protein
MQDQQHQQHQQHPAPDFGEPWRLEAYNSPLGESGDFEGVIEIRSRFFETRIAEAWNPEDEHTERFNRAIACVNACASMRDPAAEIQALRDAARLLSDFVEHIDACDENKLLECDNDPHPPSVFSVYRDYANAALAKLKALA